jgi:hypothetical protein
LTAQDFGSLDEVIRDLEQQPGQAPSRATVYGWAKAWHRARQQDHSGEWTLFSPGVTRPDIVLATLAAATRVSLGRITSLTLAEAHWVERLATAAPAILEPLTWTFEYDGDTRTGRRVDGWQDGEIRLLSWAREFVDAEASGEPERMASVHAAFVAAWARPTHSRED